jgi:hypothetical protein
MLRRWSGIVILAAILGGCAGPSLEQRSVYRSGQEWKLSRAVALTREANRSAAAQVLDHIIAEPAVPGVTDEAFFRRALLRLETEQGEGGIAHARKDLERLGRKFPGSSWAPEASLIARFLAGDQERVRQEQKLQGLNHALALENGRLKELNGALAKENRDLRQTLDKLKSLDMELGKKP